ncbi:ABC transporter transmembrane domain-containing protein, partial [Pseudomonas sp. B329]
FGHAIRLRNSARPRSTGTFISQVRELEQIRELITSSTITALADLPFFLLFLGVFWLLVGPLVLVPLCALVLMVTPGLLCQAKLGRLANEALRESSLRNALLVETIQGMEDVKALQAEQKFQLSWNHYNATTASANLRLKALTHRLQYWSQSMQTLVFAVVIFF